MTAPLYTPDILRLAAGIPHHQRLHDPAGSSEKRSPVCGSRVVVDVTLDDAGRVREAGLEVRACAFGQAASAVMAAHLIGRTPDELAEARDRVAAWLDGAGDMPDWPGVAVFAPALGVPAKHPAIRLAFEAAADAAIAARDKTCGKTCDRALAHG
jgi:NifU-like protein involved in Fe-S cluster formation